MPEIQVINPLTLDAALKAKAGKNVVALAGGTDLLVRLHDILDRPWPKLLILSEIKSLHKISANSKHITIGPLVTFSEIENSEALKKYSPQLVQAATWAGSVQIRNRATIGGNIANGSPAGDLIPPLYVLGAELELSSKNGKRVVAVEKFFTGPGKTILKSNELISSISVNRISNLGFFLRLATRRALAISKVSVACSVLLRKGSIGDIKIALGSVAPTVIRASRTEKALIGAKLSPENIFIASEIVTSEACPIDDIRSNAEYRRAMTGVLLKKGLMQIYNSVSNAQ
jgi:xanthine dehydrogenase FAD-binding subunit